MKNLYISAPFKSDIYPMYYRVIVGDDVDRIADELQYELHDDYLATTIRGYTEQEGKKMACVEICLNPFSQYGNLTPGVIAHECLHACELTFEAIHASMDAGEPLNYLLQWITDEVTTRLEAASREIASSEDTFTNHKNLIEDPNS